MKISELFQAFVQNQKEYFTKLKEQQHLHKSEEPLGDLYRRVHQEAKPVFVLSTGRVGTKLLTQIAGFDKEIYAVHEPYPELTYHSVEAYLKPKDPLVEQAVDVARYELIRNAFLLSKKYIETNNRITFFAYALAELYPGAKFVHLVRNPIDFVKSGIQRNWYSGMNFYDEGRIKEDDAAVWNGFTLAEKIAWLWAHTNQFIEEFKLSKPDRCFTIKSEDLYSGGEMVKELVEFMGVQVSSKEINRLTKQKVNASNGKNIGKIELNIEGMDYWHVLKAKYNY